MKVVETDLPGCLLLEPQVFGDERGFFYESFNHDKLAAHGLAPDFVQGNVSRSARGVLRGLHYQWPKPQGKFVSVLEGEVARQALMIGYVDVFYLCAITSVLAMPLIPLLRTAARAR